MDEIDFVAIFKRRPSIMKSPPTFPEGAYKSAMSPCGTTTEYLRLLLDCEKDCDKFWFFCKALAQARIRDKVLSAVKMGRITALQKPSGGIRGIFVGRLARRLVSRTVAQQIGPAVEVATAPHQHVMSA